MASHRVVQFTWLAWLAAKKSVRTARYALEELAQNRYEEVQEGRYVVSTAENGGSVSFSVPANLGAEGVASLAHDAIRFIDEEIPTSVWDDKTSSEAYFFPKRITRLKPRFSVTEAF